LVDPGDKAELEDMVELLEVVGPEDKAAEDRQDKLELVVLDTAVDMAAQGTRVVQCKQLEELVECMLCKSLSLLLVVSIWLLW